MEQQYLIDTNAVIDYLGNLLPINGAAFMDNITPAMTTITVIEVLGWFNATPSQIAKLKPFVDNAIDYQIDEAVVNKTIQLRQQHKIKSPDAIITATALLYNLTLISRDTTDFKNIDGLNVIDPHSL
jgi:predicted nucleic acid-binding protein